jgi:hypothetical protein
LHCSYAALNSTNLQVAAATGVCVEASVIWYS